MQMSYPEESVRWQIVIIVSKWKLEVFEKRKIKSADMIFERKDLKTWRRKQRKNSSILVIYKGKDPKVHPLWEEIVIEDIACRIYWSYWDALLLKNDVPYKKWKISIK